MAKPDRKLRLLARLVRLREAEKHAATRRVANVETTQRQLLALGQRTGDIAASYQRRRDAMTGGELIAQRAFLGGLSRIRSETAQQAEAVTEEREAARHQLASARHRYEITADRLDAQNRALAEEKTHQAGAANPKLARKLKSI